MNDKTTEAASNKISYPNDFKVRCIFPWLLDVQVDENHCACNSWRTPCWCKSKIASDIMSVNSEFFRTTIA